MVSCSGDAHSNMVYPTHPNSVPRAFPNLTFLPDPSVISINGVTIGLTSTDVLSHLIEAELSQYV